MSHVRLVPTCDLSGPAGPRCVCSYDPLHHQVLAAPGDGRLHVWSCVKRGSAAMVGQGAAQVSFVSSGPVRAASFSADRTVLGLMRGAGEVEFTNRDDGSQFFYRCRPGQGLLGFFWSRSSLCSVAFVSSAGLEACRLTDSRQGLTLVASRKHAVHWYKYSEAARVVLLATGARARKIQCYQLAASELVKLPSFELPCNSHAEPVRAEDVSLVLLYGKVYCCHVDRSARELVLYRLFRDSVVPQQRYRLYFDHAAVSVVDNVLLVHDPGEAITVLYDILSGSDQPVASPLGVSHDPGRGEAASASASASPRGGVKEPGAEVTWSFMPPNMVADRAGGQVWRLELDLEAIINSMSLPQDAVSFLQRRDEAAHAASPKQLSLRVLEDLILEGSDMTALHSAFLVTCAALEAVRGKKRQPAPLSPGCPTPAEPEGGSGPPPPAVGPADVLEGVFRKVQAARAVPDTYLLAAVEAYLLCLEASDLPPPPPELALLVIDLLESEGKLYQIQQCLAFGGLMDSVPLAERLLSLGRGACPEARELGLEMLGRLGYHEQVCRELLQEGRLLDGLSVLRKYRLEGISPHYFLEASLKDSDPTLFVAVFRFCREFVPDFEALSGSCQAALETLQLC